MNILDKFSEGEALLPKGPNRYSLRTKLLASLIPSIFLVLALTGFITYYTSSHFLNQAVGRSAQIQVRAIGHEIEDVLSLCAEDLRFIAQDPRGVSGLRKNFENIIRMRDIDYREFGFISQTDRSHVYFLADKDRIIQVQAGDVSQIRPNPLAEMGRLMGLKPGEVWISNIMEVEHPFPSPENPSQTLRSEVLYFATPLMAGDNSRSGLLILSIDVRTIRNILSVYNSPQSPIFSFPRTQELRFTYLFDLSGWILFQSGNPAAREAHLDTELVRTNFEEGILGRPGLPSAYRPASVYPVFWKMVTDTRGGHYGILNATGPSHPGTTMRNYFLAYTPIRFDGRVFAGLAYVDRTRLLTAAGYRHLDIMMILSLITISLISLLIFILSHVITKPIYRLAEAVNRKRNSRILEPIEILPTGYEERLLQQAINDMIAAIRNQLAELQEKNQKIQDNQLKQRVCLEDPSPRTMGALPEEALPEIIGYGERIERFKSDVLKAANADADVLVIGETGTGKQLAAVAIHRHSRRSEKPFISINCGELSENLLLDTLFGHVRGAFTEAKTDRKGAFLEAHGGTLFLDEIQSASMDVQQALLRAIAERKIKPLGSDREIDIDVRLIAATNVDLGSLIEKGAFRSDLYFRLKVITIYTPSLREHRENIPVLIEFFLRQLRQDTRRDNLGISRGALEKMKQYDWPGNVREVMNSITRAAVMTESDVIQASDILLESDTFRRSGENLTGFSVKVPSTPTDRIPMNGRQRKVLPHLLSRRIITRGDYQHFAGGNVSARTANYDLQDLVKKGFLKREGSGPATKYRLME